MSVCINAAQPSWYKISYSTGGEKKKKEGKVTFDIKLIFWI